MFSAAQNPFRISRLHGVDYILKGISWDELLAQLESFNYRAAIAGKHGHGKSTLLNALGNRLEERGISTLRLFLNASRRRLDPDVYSEFKENTVALFDGAEQLDWLGWHRFLWRSNALKGLVITCHTPKRLPTLYECATSHALLDDLIETLHPAMTQEQRTTAHELFEHHAGDLRQVFFSLYHDYMIQSPE
ncbi:MAG TPA: hypothetical protein PLI09_16710 [Candidatus Hydrogenedentes bacterium]|nr:hypothetical protein [Candidatus Hydrogenedentota bacterium]